MRRNEILARQNKVVYILLVLVGALGLAWSLWSHMRHTDPVAPAPTHSLPAATTPAPR